MLNFDFDLPCTTSWFSWCVVGFKLIFWYNLYLYRKGRFTEQIRMDGIFEKIAIKLNWSHRTQKTFSDYQKLHVSRPVSSKKLFRLFYKIILSFINFCVARTFFVELHLDVVLEVFLLVGLNFNNKFFWISLKRTC